MRVARSVTSTAPLPRGRGDDFLQEKIKTGVHDEIRTMKGQGFDRAAIGGRLLEIEDRVQERVTGHAPDRLEGDARPGPERQSQATDAGATGSAPRHPDLDAGVRGADHQGWVCALQEKTRKTACRLMSI